MCVVKKTLSSPNTELEKITIFDFLSGISYLHAFRGTISPSKIKIHSNLPESPGTLPPSGVSSLYSTWTTKHPLLPHLCPALPSLTGLWPHWDFFLPQIHQALLCL